MEGFKKKHQQVNTGTSGGEEWASGDDLGLKRSGLSTLSSDQEGEGGQRCSLRSYCVTYVWDAPMSGFTRCVCVCVDVSLDPLQHSFC